MKSTMLFIRVFGNKAADKRTFVSSMTRIAHGVDAEQLEQVKTRFNK
jgi:hypothetical protein